MFLCSIFGEDPTLLIYKGSYNVQFINFEFFILIINYLGDDSSGKSIDNYEWHPSTNDLLIENLTNVSMVLFSLNCRRSSILSRMFIPTANTRHRSNGISHIVDTHKPELNTGSLLNSMFIIFWTMILCCFYLCFLYSLCMLF
jgi:hypothetical protein